MWYWQIVSNYHGVSSSSFMEMDGYGNSLEECIHYAMENMWCTEGRETTVRVYRSCDSEHYISFPVGRN